MQVSLNITRQFKFITGHCVRVEAPVVGIDELADLLCRLWFDSDLLEVLLESPESLLDSSFSLLSSLEPELEELGV